MIPCTFWKKSEIIWFYRFSVYISFLEKTVVKNERLFWFEMEKGEHGAS